MKQYNLYIKKLLLLAIPIIFSNIISASSGIINMIFIAKINPEALAAGAIITSTYGLIIMIVISILFSVSIMVGQAQGTGRYNEIGGIVFSGAAITFIFGIPLTVVMLYITPIFELLQQPTQVSELAGQYFHGVAYGLIPSLMGALYTQFLMGISKTKIILYFTILGVLLNTALSYLFIFGLGQVEPMGVFGAGLATSVTSYILLFLALIYLNFFANFDEYQLFKKISYHFSYLSTLLKIGIPISLQYSIELLAFSTATYLMGTLGADALGAQQITLQCSMFAIMIVMGISQSGSILTSQSIGKVTETKLIANCTLIFGFLIMLTIGIVYWFAPLLLVSIYLNINDPVNNELISLAKIILSITAFTQLFDAGRNIAAGLLRGGGDTKSSMWTSLISCWLIGIPSSIFLGFGLNLGATGIRLGMMIGILVGCIHLINRVYKGIRNKPTSSLYNISLEGS